MKIIFKSIVLIISFGVMSPLFAQDLNQNNNCCDQSAATTEVQKIELAPAEWISLGSEQQTLQLMTMAVHQQVQSDAMASNSVKSVSKKRASRQNKKEVAEKLPSF